MVVGDAALQPQASASNRRRNMVGSVLVFLFLLAAWWTVAALGLVNDIILPPPLDVGKAIVASLSEGFFYKHLGVTTTEVALGFLGGAVVGLVLGAVLGISPTAREIGYPYIVALQGLPKIVLAPLFVVMFGFGMVSKVVMAAAICFFPILMNTWAGIVSVDPRAVLLFRSMTASSRQILWKLSLPHALPQIFAGLKTGLTFALVGALVGEFVASSEGLGYLLDVYSYQLQVDRVWAITFILAALGVFLFLIVEWADRKVVFWADRSQLSSTS